MMTYLFRLGSFVVVSALVAIMLSSVLNNYTRVAEDAFAEIGTFERSNVPTLNAPNAPTKNYLPIIFLNAPMDSFWSLAGNSGTLYGTNFLGTTDNISLTLRVNNQVGWRLAPNGTDTPNVIGGHISNTVASGIYGAVIGGGGAMSNGNRVSESYGTVGGGKSNTANNIYATVGGGESNTAGNSHATVGGGNSNTASGLAASIGGGNLNIASNSNATIGGGSSNSAGGLDATVGGGISNIASNTYATVGGGANNTASSLGATIGGGDSNRVSGSYAAVGGGYSNIVTGTLGTIAGGGRSVLTDTSTANRVSDNYGTIGGGGNNQAGSNDGNATNHTYATIGGGLSNTASNDYATIGGGSGNMASGFAAIVSGGSQNTASGNNSTVPGGILSTASASYSFAAGYRAKANHTGTFVWGDSTSEDITSTVTNQFVIRATNGVSLSVNAGSAKTITVGERYRDNAIIAWARITSGGSLSADFGVESVVNGTGIYTITISAQATSSGNLIPIAIAEVDGANLPNSAANARLVTVNQIGDTQFIVYITNGNFTFTDNDFLFIVTGR